MQSLPRTFFLCFALLGAPSAASAQSLFGGLPVDGIPCQNSEGVRVHVHAQLQLIDRGRALVVPAAIGIPSGAACLYWLHTHAANGIIHVESPVDRVFDLGQFFDIWGMNLSATQAAQLQAPRGSVLTFKVNGMPWRGDPRAIPLRDRESIVIERGPPFVAPAKIDWSNL